MESAQLQMVEFGRLTVRDWAQLVGHESAPFGARCAQLEFQPKDHHVGIRDADGELVAAAGWTVASVRVDGGEPFVVNGVGALIVRRELRGQGLAEPIMARVGERLDDSPIGYRMLFCEPHLEGLYRTRAYAPIPDPIWFEQPGGSIRSPLTAMWRGATPDSRWPSGVVEVLGLPF